MAQGTARFESTSKAFGKDLENDLENILENRKTYVSGDVSPLVGRQMNATAGGAVVRWWGGVQCAALLLACAVLPTPPAPWQPTHTVRAWGLIGGIVLSVLPLEGVSGERAAWGRRDEVLADEDYEGGELTLGLRRDGEEERETSRWKVLSLVSRLVSRRCQRQPPWRQPRGKS